MSRQEINDLTQQVGKLAEQAREHGGLLSELAPEVQDQRETLAKLVDLVKDMAGAEVDDGDAVDPDLTVVAWHTLDQQQARRAWDSLVTWLDEVAVPVYRITRSQLPDCWPRHAAIRNELSWLRTAHAQAYREGASAALVGEWHTRHLPAVLDRIHGHATGWGRSARTCGVGQCADRVGESGLPYDQDPDEIGREITGRSVWDLGAIEDDIDARPAPPEEDDTEQ